VKFILRVSGYWDIGQSVPLKWNLWATCSGRSSGAMPADRLLLSVAHASRTQHRWPRSMSTLKEYIALTASVDSSTSTGWCHDLHEWVSGTHTLDTINSKVWRTRLCA